MATENQISETTPTFELKRFVWATPDRLELSGTFGGLQDAPVDAAPVLVVRAGDNVHRLPAVADTVDGRPEDGRVWQAAFAWQDAPVAFGVAELHLGRGLVVHLPEPSAKRLLSRTRVLQVQTAETGEPAAVAELPATNGEASSSLGSQVELLAAQEEAREARVALEQTQAELARAREDLQAERDRRAADSERFRDGLAQVRESAEKALAEAHESIEAKDAALETLRGQLEAAATGEENAREQLAKLENDAKETGQLRTELERAYGSVEETKGDVERLLARLTAIRPG